MGLALIVIPDLNAPSREHRLDAQEVFYLARLEDPALGVNQRNAVAAELETACEIGGIENPTFQESKPVHMVESRLAKLEIVPDRGHCASTQSRPCCVGRDLSGETYQKANGSILSESARWFRLV
jgi:hypothetical protein